MGMTIWLTSSTVQPMQVFNYGHIVKIISQFYFLDNPCRGSPCLNNGTCQSSGDVVFCDCPENFDGDFCENFASCE